MTSLEFVAKFFEVKRRVALLQDTMHGLGQLYGHVPNIGAQFGESPESLRSAFDIMWPFNKPAHILADHLMVYYKQLAPKMDAIIDRVEPRYTTFDFKISDFRIS